MVVGERERQHQARLELAVLPDGPLLRARHAEDRDLRRVDDRGERRPADAAEARDREAAALHLGGRELAGPRLAGELAEVARQLIDVLATGVADHRHDEAVRGVGGEPEVQVFLEHEVLDRKSTRLNSSHSQISYAVFCLKKKNTPAPLAT